MGVFCPPPLPDWNRVYLFAKKLCSLHRSNGPAIPEAQCDMTFVKYNCGHEQYNFCVQVVAMRRKHVQSPYLYENTQKWQWLVKTDDGFLNAFCMLCKTLSFAPIDNTFLASSICLVNSTQVIQSLYYKTGSFKYIMAIRVVEFSNGGYKIRNIFP